MRKSAKGSSALGRLQADPTAGDGQLLLDLGRLERRAPARTPRRPRVAREAPRDPQDYVEEFHRAFGLMIQHAPNVVGIEDSLLELRMALIEEEVGELADALRDKSLIKIADALGDIIYVVYGAAVTFGINLRSVLEEIHQSNMSKLDSRGRPIFREDGKVLKSDSYHPPDIAAALYVDAVRGMRAG